MSAVMTPTPIGTSTPPPAISRVRPSPQPFRWTIEQYRELYKTGLFCDMKTMLIHGEVYAMVMPNPPHSAILNLAYECLRAAFVPGYHIRNQQGFDIGSKNDPGPDLAVIAGTILDYLDRNPTTAALIVEVSDSTVFFDSTTKAELYATAGVPEYWVMDVENRQLFVYRDPVELPAGLGATAYRTHLVFGTSDSVTPLAIPATSIRVSDLFPPGP